MFIKSLAGLALLVAVVATPFALAPYNSTSAIACMCCGEDCTCKDCSCDAQQCSCNSGNPCACSSGCSSSCCDKGCSDATAKSSCCAKGECAVEQD